MNAKIGSEEWMANIRQKALDNHANQLNPNNEAYSKSMCNTMPAVKINPETGFHVAAGIAIGAVAVGTAAFLLFRNYVKKRNEPKPVTELPEEIEVEYETVDEVAC